MMYRVEEALAQYLVDLFGDYGINLDISYDNEVDVLTEFRRNIPFRLANEDRVDKILDKYRDKDQGNKSTYTYAVYNREPIRKHDRMTNNIDVQHEAWAKNLKEQGVEIRAGFFGTSRMRFRVLFNSHKITDLFELVYTSQIANRDISVKIDYHFGDGIEPLEEVPYTFKFSEIQSIDRVSNSSLRILEFEIGIEGTFILPFSRNTYLIELVELVAKVGGRDLPPVDMTPDENTFIHYRRIIERK